MRGSVRGVAAERARLRRRRVMVLALALTAVVIQFVQRDERQAAIAKPRPPVPAVSVEPTPSASPSIKPSPAASPAAATVSVAPAPSPKGPPFVLDAAPSCAGRTALIDLQVAATAARAIARLELFLDGAASSLTPAPSVPTTSYAGRSSGPAAPGGSGQWMIRAIDAQGIADTRVYPYACG